MLIAADDVGCTAGHATGNELIIVGVGRDTSDIVYNLHQDDVAAEFVHKGCGSLEWNRKVRVVQHTLILVKNILRGNQFKLLLLPQVKHTRWRTVWRDCSTNKNIRVQNDSHFGCCERITRTASATLRSASSG